MQRRTTAGSATDRRDAWVAEQVARTAIDEAMIRTLVDDFYDRIRRDPVLAPIFASRVTDWPAHLGTMVDFWSGVALMSGRYKGKPVLKHAPMTLGRTDFTRWLDLFRESANAVCTSAAAEFFIVRAERVAESLQVGRGEEPGPVHCTGISLDHAT